MRDHEPAHRPAATSWRLAVPAMLTMAILLIFMPALDAGLVDWDDDDLLFFNTRYQTVGAAGLRWMFTTSFAGHYHPLTWLSYAFDWALWKREWFGYHLTSVLLHAATAIAFYCVARRLLACAGASMGTPSKTCGTDFPVGQETGWKACPTKIVLGAQTSAMSAPAVWAAAWAAGLFALHPLRAESVTWLAARSDVLSGLFYVVAVGCYLRYADPRGDPSGRPGSSSRRLFYLAAVASCMLSLLAKATAVTLPFVLLILDVYPLRRWVRRRGGGCVDDGEAHASLDGDPIAARRSSAAGVWLGLDKVPFLALSLVFVIRATIARKEGGALLTLGEHGIPARLAQACYGLMFYLWKTLWPTNLGPLYEIPPRDVLFGPVLWVSAAVVVVLILAAVALRRRYPAIPAALGVYAVTLVPVLGFVQSGPQLVADRYSYVPCLSLALLGGGVLFRSGRTDTARRHPGRRAGLALGCAVVLAGLGQMTFRQADIWLSALTLWARGVRVSPDSPIAHTNLADVLFRIEAFEDAAHHYQRALELNPNDAVALHHYATLLERGGFAEAAIAHYIRALRIDPARPRACLSLARLLVARERAHEAVLVLRDGATRHPDARDIIDYLAQLLSTHPDETVRHGEEAVRWAQQLIRAGESADPAALLTLATAYAEAGRFEDAVDAATRALAMADANGNGPLASELKRRLALFRDGRPVRMGD